MRTTAEIDSDLEKLYAARVAIVTSGQSYSVGGRSLTRANLDDINRTIRELEAERRRAVNAASGAPGDGIYTASFE